MSLIYHITTRPAWDHAQSIGVYTADSLISQGFIHCSTREQITRVADVVFRGQSDLVLLCVDSAKLKAELRFEPPDNQIPAHHVQEELFPHLYGLLNTDAVVKVIDFPARTDGTFALPPELDA